MTTRGTRYDAMTVVEYGQEGKSRWTKIGAAFVNENGSIGVQLDALPVNGKIILQIPLSKEEREQRWKQRVQEEKHGRSAPRGRGRSSPQRALPQAPPPPKDDFSDYVEEQDDNAPFPE